MSMYHVHAPCPWRPEEDVEMELQMVVNHHVVALRSTEGQPALLASELSLQPKGSEPARGYWVSSNQSR